MRFNKTLISKVLVFLLLIALLYIPQVPTLHADETTTESEAELNQKKREVKEKKNQKKDELAYLNTVKDGVLDEIQAIDSKISSSLEEIRDLTDKRNALENQSSFIDIKLQNAYVAEKNQYDSMKDRIKFAYENNDVEYIDALLAVKDFDEILNESEYVSKVSEYDRKQLEELLAIEEEIASYKDKLKTNISEVNDLKAAAEEEEKNLEASEAAKQELLAEYNVQIGETESEIDQLVAAEEEIEAALGAIAAAYSKAAADEVVRTVTVPTTTATVSEQTTAVVHITDASGTDATVIVTEAPTAAPTTQATTTTTYVYNGPALVWPCPVSYNITSPFGYRTSPTAGASSYHKGIDIGCPMNSQVLAAQSGTVIYAAYYGSGGNAVMIDHHNGMVTQYFHLSSYAVSVGQTVTAGQVVAYSGSTGVSTGPHLHFGVMVNGGYVNPLSFF